MRIGAQWAEVSGFAAKNAAKLRGINVKRRLTPVQELRKNNAWRTLIGFTEGLEGLEELAVMVDFE
jgi:hypothetical protein